METGNWKLGVPLLGLSLLACTASAGSFTGPAEWRLVNTNAVNVWNGANQKKSSSTFNVWPGVTADTLKREVRLLAEAVGHPAGITAEFLLVGPFSDRVYEAAAVTVAQPGDIVRAVESLGMLRGGGVGSRPFRFWPCGERLTATFRLLSAADAAEKPLQALLRDAETASPLIGEGGLVFTGGRWEGQEARRVCLTDTNLPCSVISLFNEPGTVFDVPFRVGQSEVYGRLCLAEALPYGALMEIALRPLPAKDGAARMLPLAVRAELSGQEVSLSCKGSDGTMLKQAGLADALVWLRAKEEEGRELFVTLDLDDAMPLKRAVDIARVFAMLDGKGIKLDGKTGQGLFPKAFLPQEKWRERKDRNPQPFELHVARDAGGGIKKKLIFIEEDWKVEGLDPKLTPREFPFDKWDELPKLIGQAAGTDNRVKLLFVFAPADQPLAVFMPGVRAVAGLLPLVYVFGE